MLSERRYIFELGEVEETVIRRIVFLKHLLEVFHLVNKGHVSARITLWNQGVQGTSFRENSGNSV